MLENKHATTPPAPTMQQLMFVKPHNFEWQEVVTPRITDPVQALVKPLAVSRCDLDLYIANGQARWPGGFAFGHEIAGVVLDIGSSVSSVTPGDRVIVPFQISCGSCGYCLQGLTNACTTVAPYSAYGLAPSCGKDWGGGFSDALLVPYADHMLVPIPQCLSLEAAATLSDNAIDGFRTVQDRLRTAPGASVLVLGALAQSVGLFAVLAATRLGADRVVYCDDNPARRAAASALGAETTTFKTLTEEGPPNTYPVVVDAACTPAALELALQQTAPCGHCISVSNGLATTTPELPIRKMYMKGATWEISRVHARGSLHEALACTDCGFDPDQVISKRLRFEDAADTMDLDAIKCVYTRD